MSDLLIGLSEIFNGSKGAALLTLVAFFIIWLSVALLTSKKKEFLTHIKKLYKDNDEIKSVVKSIQLEQHKEALTMENIKGQLSIALALPAELKALEERVWAVDAKASAAWKVIDQKRTSDL